MVGQGFGEAAVTREGSSPVTVFLTIGNQSGIFFKPVQNGFKDGIAILEHLVLGNRFPIYNSRARLLGQSLHAGIVVM